MKNDPNFNHVMAGVYRSAFAVSALTILLSTSAAHAADPPVPRSNVSVNVNPTTGYYSVTNSTLRLPNGVSAAPTSGALPVVTKYSGGLQQTIPTGITIDAIKKSAPLPAVVRSTTQTVKSAAGRCLKSGRCNVALLVAGEGLNRLFDGLDWVMGEGGKVRLSTEPDNIQAPALSESELGLVESSLSRCMSGRNLPPDRWASSVRSNCVNPVIVEKTTSSYNGYISGTVCESSSEGYGLMGYSGGLCRYGTGTLFNPRIERPLSDGEIDAGVENNYTPEPSDWPALTREMHPDDIEITSAPTLQGEPKTTTVYDVDGNPHKVTQTNIWYDFDIRDNPSPRPALDMKTREETKTYENGELTGTTTTESTASGGSGDTSLPPESPIDCDLFPTACAWFDWTQEEPTEPDDDLSGLLQEVPIVSETFTITGGVAACPAPMVLDLSVFGSREVSYQPLCDLASTMKYLYLALMSFAAAVLLNRSVNRV